MGILITALIAQWIILLVWIIFMKLEENDEDLPSFLQGLLMILVPFGVIGILLAYLYKNDKNKN